MKTWYIYRTFYLFWLIPKIGKAAFSFCKDRKFFTDCVSYWRDTAPIVFKQLMIEAELTRKYKAWQTQK